MSEVYISTKHTPLALFYRGWIEKGLDVKIISGFNQIREGTFPETLADTIKKCDNFIAIFTSDTFGYEDDNESWMAYEIETALKNKINVIPVVSADFVWPSVLPARMAEIKKIPPITMQGKMMSTLDIDRIMGAIKEISARLIDRNKKDLFISYSSTDQPIAENIKKELEKYKVSCWMAPDSIPAGSDYASEIPAAIKNGRICLVILSENSQKSKWVPKEIEQAIDEGLTIIPYQIDDSKVNTMFEFLLKNCQRINAYNDSTALKKLTNVILNILQ